jgi:ribonuclease J
MGDKIRVFSLGGLDEEGKNCSVVDINGDLLVVGCGIKFPDKTMPGIDYIIPDFTYLIENKDRVKGYLIPHGHFDETFALPYIYDQVPAPIYCSLVTATMLRRFAARIRSEVKFNIRIVSATSRFSVAGHEVNFFQTSHNIAQSSAIAIGTSYGNIIFTSDFVVENNADKDFLHDTKAIAKLSESPTLMLLAESMYSSRPGYTAPKYKLAPLVNSPIKDATGRTFVALTDDNFYNIDEIIRAAVSCHKRIIPYDKESADVIEMMQSCGQLMIPPENFAPIDDINRYRDQDIVILLLGHGPKLYNKIALLAAGQNENRQTYITPNDTFIEAAPADDTTELEATDALDELYRSGCHVVNITRKMYLRMHASEEDLKMMLGIFRPKYYVPVKGYYKDMLTNAKVALSMGIGLTHQNVFLLENGLTIKIDGGSASIVDEGIPHNDILIDGIGVGDVKKGVLEERQRLSDGVVILGATVSRGQSKLVAGPDVQIRGLVYSKDAESLTREVTKIFETALDESLKDPGHTADTIRQASYERVMKALRRQTGKEPYILPLIVEIP